jgi:hypothetical protein
VDQDVAKATTETTLTSSVPGNSIYRELIVFTAVVGATSPGNPGTPGGKVVFMDGATVLKTVKLVNGKATYKTSKLIAGSHDITANYLGGAKFDGSDNGLTHDVDAAPTTITLSSSPKVWAIGQAVRFTATLTTPTVAVPAGSVTFQIDGPNDFSAPLLPAVTLVKGKATSSSFLFPATPGDYTVTVHYTPSSANFEAGSESRDQTVLSFTKATISSSSNSSGTRLFARISGASGAGTPTGTVNFYEIVAGVRILLGQGDLNANGVATFFANLSSGSHKILVEYLGDAIFNPATKTATVLGKVNGRLV